MKNNIHINFDMQLCNPIKLKILALALSRGILHDISYKELKEIIGVTDGNLWSALVRLREADLITIWKGKSSFRKHLTVTITSEGMLNLKRYWIFLQETIPLDMLAEI